MTFKQYLYIIGGCLVIFGLGVGVGHYGTPPKVQEKIVEKDVEHKQDNVVTTVTETKKPDGTDTTVTQTVDKSVENSTTTDNTTVMTSSVPQWHATLGYGYDFKNVMPVYMGAVDKKLLGPVSVGIFGVSNGTLGVTVGLEF